MLEPGLESELNILDHDYWTKIHSIIKGSSFQNNRSTIANFDDSSISKHLIQFSVAQNNAMELKDRARKNQLLKRCRTLTRF